MEEFLELQNYPKTASQFNQPIDATQVNLLTSQEK